MNSELVKNKIEELENVGYCVVPQVFSKEQTADILALCKEWYAKTVNETSENVPFLNRNQMNIYNLQNKDAGFLKAIFHSQEIEEILKYFLNDQWYKQIPQTEPNYILRACAARSSNEILPMHIDSFVPYIGKFPFVMQFSIILEDQTVDNGCTIVVPESHKTGQYANQESAKTALPIESKAGDVVMWDSRVWHGTTENKTNGTRWAVIATFARWWIKQYHNVVQNMPQEIYTQLTDKEKAIMGFCSIPYNDEFEGIDLKRGWEDLKNDVSSYKTKS